MKEALISLVIKEKRKIFPLASSYFPARIQPPWVFVGEAFLDEQADSFLGFPRPVSDQALLIL